MEVDRTTAERADRPLRDHARLRPRAASRHGRRARSPAASPTRSARRCYEEHAYGPDGSFLSGTLADYLVPDRDGGAGPDHPAPRDAVAVHAARRQGRRRGQLHVHAGLHRQRGGRRARACRCRPCRCCRRAWPSILHGPEPAPPQGRPAGAGRRSPASGSCSARGAPTVDGAAGTRCGQCCSIPTCWRRIVPGAHGVEKLSDTQFRAEVTLGIGPVKGRYRAEIALSDLDPPRAVTLSGSADGALGLRRAAPGGVHAGSRRRGRTVVAYATRRRSAARSPPSAGGCWTARRASSSASSSRRWRRRRAASGAARRCSPGCCALLRRRPHEAGAVRLRARREHARRRWRRCARRGGEARVLAGGQIAAADAEHAARAARPCSSTSCAWRRLATCRGWRRDAC